MVTRLFVYVCIFSIGRVVWADSTLTELDSGYESISRQLIEIENEVRTIDRYGDGPESLKAGVYLQLVDSENFTPREVVVRFLGGRIVKKKYSDKEAYALQQSGIDMVTEFVPEQEQGVITVMVRGDVLGKYSNTKSLKSLELESVYNKGSKYLNLLYRIRSEDASDKHSLSLKAW